MKENSRGAGTRDHAKEGNCDEGRRRTNNHIEEECTALQKGKERFYREKSVARRSDGVILVLS